MFTRVKVGPGPAREYVIPPPQLIFQKRFYGEKLFLPAGRVTFVYPLARANS